MTKTPALRIRDCFLGFELYQGEQLITLYRAREELARDESPKPCFAPIYTPDGGLVTEYRPKDHVWHTGLYYGWVHVNDANLWGGPWYFPDKGKYEHYPDTHGRQVHESFGEMQVVEDGVHVVEMLTWRDGADAVMAEEERVFRFRALDDVHGSFWTVTSRITPACDVLRMGASRAAKYSGLELRLGPPFADAQHRTSEGLQGHEAIMGTQARWCCAAGAAGGAVLMLDHPQNPRHPTPWFTRRNLMGAGLLMGGDLETPRGETLCLRYGFAVLADDPPDAWIEALFAEFATD